MCSEKEVDCEAWKCVQFGTVRDAASGGGLAGGGDGSPGEVGDRGVGFESLKEDWGWGLVTTSLPAEVERKGAANLVVGETVGSGAAGDDMVSGRLQDGAQVEFGVGIGGDFENGAMLLFEFSFEPGEAGEGNEGEDGSGGAEDEGSGSET